MKQCRSCKKHKPLSEFYTNKHLLVCRICHRTTVKLWRANNPDKHQATKRLWRKNNADKIALQAEKYKPRRRTLRRKEWLKKLYGLSERQYQKILIAQNGVCSVCGLPETHTCKGKVIKLAVDHCHKTNKVRGLLCKKCNVALGLLGDNLDVLASASSYLINSA